jgi:hypothetical protein
MYSRSDWYFTWRRIPLHPKRAKPWVQRRATAPTSLRLPTDDTRHTKKLCRTSRRVFRPNPCCKLVCAVSLWKPFNDSGASPYQPPAMHRHICYSSRLRRKSLPNIASRENQPGPKQSIISAAKKNGKGSALRNLFGCPQMFRTASR